MTQLTLDAAPRRDQYDAVVVGSGPNGLAAAITIAREGRSVLVMESAPTVGGGMRSSELTLPGFVHDVCSAIHALAVVSPFFDDVPLEDHGLEWIYPPAAVAHPLPNGEAAIGWRSVEKTAEGLGADRAAYLRLFGPLSANGEKILAHVLGPFRPPRHPWVMSRFGWSAVRSAVGLASSHFQTELARGLFAGHAAHSVMPLENKLTAAVGLMLGITMHVGGWPVARGGSQQIADAMVRYLQSLGGEVVVNCEVTSLGELPSCSAILLDVAPQHLGRIAGDELPAGFRRKLDRYRFGPGAFKLDWALSDPIPWNNDHCGQAATVHVGGTLDEVAAAERAPWQGTHAESPFVLVAQQSLFDSQRAPSGQHTGWGYCHVPNGSDLDMTEQIEAQIERFATGFRDCILKRHVTSPADFQSYNANYVGGDITGGVMDIRQLFTRPTARIVPYSTPNRRIFICSASTPPGAGVHGMCGYFAARAALRGPLRA